MFIKIKENEMGGTCSTHGTDKKYIIELKFDNLNGTLLLIGIVNVILLVSGLSIRQHEPRSACSM